MIGNGWSISTIPLFALLSLFVLTKVEKPSFHDIFNFNTKITRLIINTNPKFIVMTISTILIQNKTTYKGEEKTPV